MKKIIVVPIFMAILVIIGLLYFHQNQQTLTKKGFSEEEITWIEGLSKTEKEYFLEQEQLYPILKEKGFQGAKLSEYIKLYQNNQTLSLGDIVLAVNNELQNMKIELTPEVLKFLEQKDFEPNRLKRYLAYQEKNQTLEIDQIVNLVNQDIDTITMEYHESINTFLNTPYFIKENLERYIQYQDKNKTSSEVTVSYVNSNLDYAYYTNTQSSDLSKGLLVIVNKYYVLDSDYVPEDLVTIDAKYGRTFKMQQTAYEAFTKMADDAKKEGLTLYIQSPYRSYQTQASLYRNYCNQDGQTLADTYSARPGYSEHQTGLAADIVNGVGKSLASFDGTKEFYWMQENAHKYGFILRYQKGKEKITGYQYEPWHYRYVGIETATKIKELNITFDEYYAYYIK